MKLKTYRAQSMGDALAAVKRELGKDAVILHTRVYRVGAWFGMGGREVAEVTASVDVKVIRRSRDPETMPARTAVNGAAAKGAYAASAPLAASVPMGAPASPGAAAPGPTAKPISVGWESESRLTLERELAAIKRMVSEVLRSNVRPMDATGAVVGAGALRKHYMRLLQHEVSREIADALAGALQSELSAEALADDEAVREAVLAKLESLVPVAAECDGIGEPPRPADRPFTVVLTGPTGVGKTTTIAKLAAAYKLRHGRRVGLVTADTYRIAAVEQLRTYAHIIGLPLRVAATAAEVSKSCAALRECDVILMDTAGRSPRDGARLEALRELIGAARAHETHLVLSSAASERALLEATERFAGLRPNRVIFSKLDEAVNFGVLVNVLQRLDATLSFMTTGQEVPDDIEAGSPARLARLVLDGPAAARVAQEA
ncbi:MAG: flagellar biosynthesis protein FlhF [Phycisphaerae bacterium]|nr:flagellar biosynthesis protein FlhF [Phycisphaerae bacterium]